MSNEYRLPVKTPRSLTYVTRNIPNVTVEQRERALKATHYNEFTAIMPDSLKGGL